MVSMLPTASHVPVFPSVAFVHVFLSLHLDTKESFPIVQSPVLAANRARCSSCKPWAKSVALYSLFQPWWIASACFFFLAQLPTRQTIHQWERLKKLQWQEFFKKGLADVKKTLKSCVPCYSRDSKFIWIISDEFIMVCLVFEPISLIIYEEMLHMDKTR